MDKTKYLDLEEVRLVRDTAELSARRDIEQGRTKGPLAWMVVDLALSTGLRASELSRINVAHIDLKRKLIMVTRSKRKTARSEALSIDGQIAEHLREYIDWRKAIGRDHESLLTGKRGRLKPQGLALIWKAALRAAKTPHYSIHKARHTCATHLYEKTKDLLLVKERLGHVNPATTANMYTHVTDKAMRDAIEGLYQTEGNK